VQILVLALSNVISLLHFAHLHPTVRNDPLQPIAMVLVKRASGPPCVLSYVCIRFLLVVLLVFGERFVANDDGLLEIDLQLPSKVHFMARAPDQFQKVDCIILLAI
jgi:hypothetical protein